MATLESVVSEVLKNNVISANSETIAKLVSEVDSKVLDFKKEYYIDSLSIVHDGETVVSEDRKSVV